MTTKTLTAEQRIALLRHLLAGKKPDIVSAIVGLPRSDVIDIASHHGYPSTDRMTRAIDLIEAKLHEGEIPTGSILPAEAQRSTATAATTTTVPLTKPDEICILINTAKGHPSKRIQNAADKLLDDIGRLRDLIKADEQKHAAAREAAAVKAAARAEVERLERQLAEAKAKLRGTPVKSPVSSGAVEVIAADVRAWAAANGVECPAKGIVPGRVREAYDAAHQGGEAA